MQPRGSTLTHHGAHINNPQISLSTTATAVIITHCRECAGVAKPYHWHKSRFRHLRSTNAPSNPDTNNHRTTAPPRWAFRAATTTRRSPPCRILPHRRRLVLGIFLLLGFMGLSRFVLWLQIPFQD
ncbi:hypothetical protein RYX36_004618 [Vicia faba]